MSQELRKEERIEKASTIPHNSEVIEIECSSVALELKVEVDASSGGCNEEWIEKMSSLWGGGGGGSRGIILPLPTTMMAE